MVEINDEQLKKLEKNVGYWVYSCDKDYTKICTANCPVFRECWESSLSEKGLLIELNRDLIEDLKNSLN